MRKYLITRKDNGKFVLKIFSATGIRVGVDVEYSSLEDVYNFIGSIEGYGFKEDAA